MKKYECEISEFASPEYRLPLVNSNSVHIPERNILVCANYSSGTDTRLYLADLKRSSAKAVRMPEGEYGIYGIEKGNDGKIYLGSFTGKLHSYDLDQNEFRLIRRIFDNATANVHRLVWGSGVSRRYNRIYMGVYPTGEFYEYDPQTGTCESFKTVNSQRGCYARYFKELHNGKILIMTTGAVHAWSIYDPENKKLKTFEIPQEKAQYVRPTGRNVILYDEERILYSSKHAVNCFNWKTGRLEKDFLEISKSFSFIFEFNGKFYGMTADGGIHSFTPKGTIPIMAGFPEG
ncbi:MAG: hypothetical protein WC082_14505, partial [Victivallales bacterium]